VAEFLVGVVLGVSVAALLFIIVGPTRRVRAERPVTEDDEAEILMGHLPCRDATGQEEPVQATDEYKTEDLQALRRLGGAPAKRRSRK